MAVSSECIGSSRAYFKKRELPFSGNLFGSGGLLDHISEHFAVLNDFRKIKVNVNSKNSSC